LNSNGQEKPATVVGYKSGKTAIAKEESASEVKEHLSLPTIYQFDRQRQQAEFARKILSEIPETPWGKDQKNGSGFRSYKEALEHIASGEEDPKEIAQEALSVPFPERNPDGEETHRGPYSTLYSVYNGGTVVLEYACRQYEIPNEGDIVHIYTGGNGKEDTVVENVIWHIHSEMGAQEDTRPPMIRDDPEEALTFPKPKNIHPHVMLVPMREYNED